MQKYYISIEHVRDISNGLHTVEDPDILIRKRRSYLFDVVVKGFGTYSKELEEYANRYCNILNSVSA